MEAQVLLSREVISLREENKQLERDVEDLLAVAEDFAPVYRCNNCNRYTREGYICVHCKTDNSL